MSASIKNFKKGTRFIFKLDDRDVYGTEFIVARVFNEEKRITAKLADSPWQIYGFTFEILTTKCTIVEN